MNQELDFYFSKEFWSSKEYNSFEHTLLTHDTYYRKIKFDTVLRIYQKELPKEYEYYGSSGLLYILKYLIKEDKISFPKDARNWNTTRRPHIPNWIQLNLPSKPANKELAEWKQFPWTLELNWIYELTNLSTYRFNLLKRLHNRLNDPSFKDEPYLPEKERSLQLFNDEKILGVMDSSYSKHIDGTFIDLCRAYYSYEPLTYHKYASHSSTSILIIENRDTFFSLNKIFTDLSTSPFKFLVYGRGKDILRNYEGLFEFTLGYYDIKYFGDIDHGGFGIYYSLVNHLLRKQSIVSIDQISIQPYQLLYQHLVDQYMTTDIRLQDRINGKIDLIGFQPNLRSIINSYLKKGIRIPQELLNLNILTTIFN